MTLTARLHDRLARAVDPMAAARVGWRLGLTGFKRQLWRGYVHTPYQALMDEKLQAVARYVATGGREGIGRLMIFMPPRHGKTGTVSRYFPAWALGEMPWIRLIMTSYGAALAFRNSRFVRNLVQARGYRDIYPRVSLAQDTKAVQEWDLTAGGGAIAAGVGGAITGHGANIALIDDPIKSRAEAESETYRQRIKDWYLNDFLTRVEEPGGAIILIQTRWQEDDLAGWLLGSEYAWEWTVISLAALAGEHDPLGRQPGEALWPERYGVEWLETREAQMGEYAFASIYQQTPKPRTGGLFDPYKIEIIDTPPECREVVRFWDLAVTKKKQSDYTVGLKLGVTADEEWIIFHVARARMEAPEVHETIVQTAAADGVRVPIRLEAEKAGLVEFQYMMRDKRLRGHRVDAKPPEGDKFTRAGPVASRVNARRVKMVRGEWNQAFLDEIGIFPAGAHDDQVDGLSGAYQFLSEPKGVLVG